jgi:hypothetical protein
MIAKSPNSNKNVAKIGIIVTGSAPPIEGFRPWSNKSFYIDRCGLGQYIRAGSKGRRFIGPWRVPKTKVCATPFGSCGVF